mmetsp:Transcript_9949/g.19617  ORF Transcript_9949/g.19617 Transcript_9949/m.19617 type:complete len:118 (-) Transcript_9949:104-457(-)
MRFANLSVATCLVLVLLLLAAGARAEHTCAPQYKGAKLTNKGKRLWRRNWTWSDPDRKHITVSECQTKCYENKKCGGWEWRGSRFGAGCSLFKYTKSMSLNKKYKCKMCDAFAGLCN